MERAWDNWERLVAAVFDKEELRRLAYCPSFSSTSSSVDLSSRFSFDFSIHDSDVSIEPETTPASQPSNAFQPAQITSKTFTFRELAVATKNFDRKCLIYEDDFGKVYRGQLKGSKHAVAIKEINLKNGQRSREFLVEIMMLSLLHHPNLVNLIGYCADGDCRLLVHKYYPLGSLYYHLHEPMSQEKPLDWNTRMKIAAGVSRGLEYLHHKADPPVVHRDLTPSNILLDEGHNPKIANFGLSKLGPVGDRTHVSTRVMGTIGYLAPEYAMTGRLTLKADIYSFGVILLELISGRKAVEVLENGEAQNIVEWARPLLKDRRKFVQMVDPTLKGQYAMRTLFQSLAVAAMCVQEQAENRPLMADVVIAMTYLASQKYDGSTV